MADVEITVRSNGPYVISGPIRVVDPNGNEFDVSGRTSVSLCRCGNSGNKPFCDGTHRKIEFSADTQVPAAK